MEAEQTVFLVIILILFSPFATADYFGSGGYGCAKKVESNMVLESSVKSCKDVGMKIVDSDIVLNCQNNKVTGETRRDPGIVAENVDNITIKNCRVNGFYSGISLKNVTNAKLINNSANSNYATGIELLNVTNTSVIDNTFNDNWDGLFLHDSKNNKIINNSAHRNKIDGIHLFYGSTGNKVYSNNLTRNKGHGLAPAVCSNEIGSGNLAGLGKPIKYIENRNNIRLEDTSHFSEIIFCNVNSSIIRNVTIHNGQYNTDGIILVNSDDNRVVKSYFEDVRTAVYLFRDSDSNKITGNTIKSSDLGVRVRYASNGNYISGNTINGTEIYLKAIKSSTENTFIYNTIEGKNLTLNYTKGLELRYSNKSLNFTRTGTIIRHERGNSTSELLFLSLLLLSPILILSYYLVGIDR